MIDAASGATGVNARAVFSDFEVLSIDVDNGQVGRWKLNETSGTTAADSRASGTPNPGTLNGNAAWTTSGMLGGAVTFDGTNDWVQIPDSADYHGTALSLTAWINPAVLDGAARAIMSKRLGSNNQAAFSVFVMTSNRLFIDLGATRVDTGLVLSTGAWRHLAITFDGALGTNRLKVYLDGASTPAWQGNVGTVTSVPDTTAPLYLGILNANYGNGWNGRIDDVRVYNRALLPSEITTIKNRAE